MVRQLCHARESLFSDWIPYIILGAQPSDSVKLEAVWVPWSLEGGVYRASSLSADFLFAAAIFFSASSFSRIVNEE